MRVPVKQGDAAVNGVDVGKGVATDGVEARRELALAVGGRCTRRRTVGRSRWRTGIAYELAVSAMAY
jgi:hypothetical protein